MKLNSKMGKRNNLSLIYGLHIWKGTGQDMKSLDMAPGIYWGESGERELNYPRVSSALPFLVKNCQDYITAGRSGQKCPQRLTRDAPHWAAGVILVQQQEAALVRATRGHR